MEKPPTTSAAAMRRVADQARAHERCLVAGSHHPWRDNVKQMKAWIDQGRLGKVYAIEARKMRHGPLPVGPAAGETLEGVTAHSAVHRIDVLHYLLDCPGLARVSASTYRHFSDALARKNGLDIVTEGSRCEDTLFAQIEFNNGCTLTLRDMAEAHLEQATTCHWPFGEFDVFGTEGVASLHPLRLRYRDPSGTVHQQTPSVDNDIGSSHGPAYRAMFDRIRANDFGDRDSRRAIAVWETLEAILQSARELEDVRDMRLE
jgi:predicted dehydrogenase